MRLHIIALVACTTIIGSAFSATAIAAEMPEFQRGQDVAPSLPTGVPPVSGKDGDDGATTDYVIAGWGEPGGWQFSMGPTRQPEFTVLRLIRRVAGGAFGLECRRQDGSLQMRFLLDGYKGTSNTTIDARLIVGSGGGPIPLLVEEPPVGKQDSGLLVTDPVAITDILYATTRENPGADFRIEFDKHSFGMQLPIDPTIMQVSASICDGWRKALQEPQQEPDKDVRRP